MITTLLATALAGTPAVYPDFAERQFPPRELEPVNAFDRFCKPGESCWPTADEVEAFSNRLNPEMTRTFGTWESTDPPNPRICGVPLDRGNGSINVNEQPLYGFGEENMLPVYSMTDHEKPCFHLANEERPACLAGTRNTPHSNPGFVVWALNADHVQKAVEFAKDHNLCIMVAGTGHDFMNRHSCREGLFIRTSLMKKMEFDVNDSDGYGWSQGNVKAGPGVVFHEIQQAASAQGKYVSSGWATSVGVAGWSMGGGHGPMAGLAGLGVDNILEVEIVTADAKVIRANKDQNSDLWKAIRGGGGSAWGIVTEFVLRTHDTPDSGFYQVFGGISGWYCNTSMAALDQIIDRYANWSLGLDKRWSGFFFVTPTKPTGSNPFDASSCGGYWAVMYNYNFIGPYADAEAKLDELKLFAEGAETVTFSPFLYEGAVPTWWDVIKTKDLEPILPWRNVMTAGVPSISVQRETVESGAWSKQIKDRLREQPAQDFWGRHEIYDDITGRTNSDRPSDVSVSSGFRNGMFHYVFQRYDDEQVQTYYDLEPHSYLGESEYGVPDWKTRHWDDYDELLKVKRKYDPTGMFMCDYCIGYGDDFPTKSGANTTVIIAAILGGFVFILLVLAAVYFRPCNNANPEPQKTAHPTTELGTTTTPGTIV